MDAGKEDPAVDMKEEAAKGAAAGAAIGAMGGLVGGPAGAAVGGAVGAAVGGAIGAGKVLYNKLAPQKPDSQPEDQNVLPVPENTELIAEPDADSDDQVIFEPIEAKDIPNAERLPWDTVKVVETLNENRKIITKLSETERILEDNGDTSTMVQCAKSGQWNGVFDILERKPYIINAIPQERAWSALHQAVYFNDSDAIEKLLKFKACDINIKTKRDRHHDAEAGMTPYQMAEARGLACQSLLKDHETDTSQVLDVTFLPKEKGTEFLATGVPYFDLASSFLRRDVLNGMHLHGGSFLYITEKMYQLLESDWRYVRNAVKECLYPFDKSSADRLEEASSPDELKAAMIWIYTSCAVYRQVNAALRRASEREFPVSDDLLLSLYSLFLTSILLHSGDLQRETQTTYRGVTMTKDKAELYQEGTTFHWMSFTSTSKNESTARNFSGGGQTNVVFVIDNSQQSMWSPRNIMAFSQYEGEQEVVHPPCARFRVTSVTETGGCLELGIKLLQPDE